MFVSSIIKFFSQINLFLGLIIRKKRKIDPAEIKTILVNRTDRIGDAVVSLPLLLELHKRFKVTVLTSKYNDPILGKFLPTEIFLESPVSFWNAIKMAFVNIARLLRLKKIETAHRYDLYLDFMGLRGQDTFLKIKEQNLCRYYVGFNLGLGNLFLDYADNKNPALFSTSNLLSSYRRLLKESLGLDLNVADYSDLSSAMSKPSDFNLSSPFILVNIAGFDKFRGPSAKVYADIVNALDFSGTFVILDEQGNPNRAAFEEHLPQKNLYYVKEDYSLWQLYFIACSSILYLGSDSGISQFLGQATNCVIFFGTGEHKVWRPYSNRPYAKRNIDGLVAEETRTCANLIKKIIYAPVWCRPCFDFGCRTYRCIKRMDSEVLAKELSLTLSEIAEVKK